VSNRRGRASRAEREKRERRSRRRLAAFGRLVAAVGLLALGLAQAGAVPAEDGAGDPDRGAIRISSAGLEPQRFEAGTEDVLSWINADERNAVLSFEEGFRAHLACDDAGRPELREDATGRVLSLPIGSLAYALPCPLEPGAYAYRVHLIERPGPPGAPVASPGQIRNPSATFEGTIEVE